MQYKNLNILDEWIMSSFTYIFFDSFYKKYSHIQKFDIYSSNVTKSSYAFHDYLHQRDEKRILKIYIENT